MNVAYRLRRLVSHWLVAWGIPLATLVSAAQATEIPPSLKQAFEATWARQPEARAIGARRDAVGARRQTADGWLAEPPSLEVSYKTDQINRDQGSREYEAGITLPLWLPGERAGQRVLTEVEGDALEKQWLAAQLRTAGEVREAWWSLALARIDLESAEARRRNAERLAADVARRVKAGDLSRADGNQADAAVAGAAVEVARTRGALAESANRLRVLTGQVAQGAVSGDAEASPNQANVDDAHPLLKAWAARVETARAARALAGTQGRANPELRLAATRDRANAGDAWSQTLTLGLRIPFGSDSRQRARIAMAAAEETESEAQLAVERERIAAGVDAARSREEAARARLAAAEQRARLADESRGFFEKSFRLGETDLPTRLRIEGEASEAEREAARARVELAASVSALRQALGLLPE